MKEQQISTTSPGSLQRTIPEFIGILLMFIPTYILASSSASFLFNGYWFQGLMYGVIGLGFLWLTLPFILGKCLRIYVIAKSLDHDYLVLDNLTRRLANFVSFIRSPYALMIQNSRAIFKIYQGSYAEAVPLLNSELQRLGKIDARNATQWITTECNLAFVYRRLQNVSESHSYIEQALQHGAELGKDWLIFPLLSNVSFLLENDDLVGAKSALREIFERIDAASIRKDLLPKVILSANLFSAIVALRENEIDRAIDLTNEALKPPLLTSPPTVKWINTLAHEYLKRNNFSMAEKLLTSSYQVLRKVPNHPDCEDTLEYFKQVLIATNRQDEVPNLLAWVRP